MADSSIDNITSSQVSSPVDSSLSFCRPDDTRCNPLSWEIPFLTLNVTSILINSLHLVILSKVKSLQGSAFLRLLQFMAVADLVEGFVSAFRVSCWFRDVLIQSRPLSACVTTLGSVITIRYHFMMSAVIERLIALSNPLHYKYNLFVRKISLWLSLQVITVLGINATLDTIFYEDICLNTYYGPNDLNSIWPLRVNFSLRTIPAIIMVAGMGKILHTLRTTVSPSITTQKKEILAATKTIMILCGMIVFCLIPPLAGIFLRTDIHVKHCNVSPISLICFFTFGISNTIVYGWRNKRYRNVVM